MDALLHRRNERPMSDPGLLYKIHIKIGFAVMVRRHQGKDEETIRRETLEIVSKEIEKLTSDLRTQESLQKAVLPMIDEELAETS